jgi:hypothetical protein
MPASASTKSTFQEPKSHVLCTYKLGDEEGQMGGNLDQQTEKDIAGGADRGLEIRKE